MHHHPSIKVIKRVERERARQLAAENTNSDLPAHENSGDPAVTWGEWVNEFRQKQLVENQIIKQRLGCWRQGGADDSKHWS